VLDEGDNRSTIFTLERLREEGSLSDDDFETLSSGYSLLRRIDHNLRLIVGRSTRLPDSDHVIARDVAKRMDLDSGHLHQTLIEKMKEIRAAYSRTLD
jgi:glutamine synthetase adenylyltransferase